MNGYFHRPCHIRPHPLVLETRIAYRMLGSWAEAEDVVQDAWLRWSTVASDDIRDPAAYLTRIVTRLSLDVLKSSRVTRETYVGPWLPEPAIEPVPDRDGITATLMLALERLSPLERAAFLLHDVFGSPFEEVAQAIGRDAAACRQLATRARAHVRTSGPRFPLDDAQARSFADAFFSATRTGDMTALRALLADEVVVHTDGGGRVAAALNVIHGAERLLRFIEGIRRKNPPSELLYTGLIDGLPGFVTREGATLQTTALDIKDGHIVAVYIVRNPEKLGGVVRFLEKLV